MIVYLNGAYVPKSKAAISPDDRGFLFADGVYEVFAAYEGRLFRTADHLTRLERSLKALRIEFGDVAVVEEIAQTLLERNDLCGTNAKVYLQITRGAAPRNHAFPGADTSPTIYACASTFARPVEKRRVGVSATFVPDNRWARCDIKTVALLPNAIAAQTAEERDAEEAIFVRDGALTEGSHTNVCAAVDGTMVTAPLSNYILPGITRAVIMELCADFAIPVREFPVLFEEVPKLDELFLVGTTAEVMPIIEVDGTPIGSGRPGTIAQRLGEGFDGLVAGAVEGGA